LIGKPAENLGPCHCLALGQSSADALEYRPEYFALLAADPGFSAQPRNIAVSFNLQLPRRPERTSKALHLDRKAGRYPWKSKKRETGVGVRTLAAFPIFTFPRRTQPYEMVRSLFNRPGVPPVNLNASSSLATIVYLAVEGSGIAIIPREIVASELQSGALKTVGIDIEIPELVFTAAWLTSPDTLAIELAADIAVQLACQ